MRLSWLTVFLGSVCLLFLPKTADAQSAAHDVTIVVREVNVISVSSGEVRLEVEQAKAGQQPAGSVNRHSSYSITTNGSAKKITAAIDSPYPEGIELLVSLEAPEGGVSTGTQRLNTQAIDLVTDLSRVVGKDLPISYEAVVAPYAVPTPGETRTVVFTIMDM